LPRPLIVPLPSKIKVPSVTVNTPLPSVSSATVISPLLTRVVSTVILKPVGASIEEDTAIVPPKAIASFKASNVSTEICSSDTGVNTPGVNTR
jgi:hypothetical protein